MKNLFLDFEYVQYQTLNSVPIFLNGRNKKKHAVKSKLMKIVLWINNEKDISLGLYIVLHYPLGGGRGKLIKGFENGEGNQEGKKRKKENGM